MSMLQELKELMTREPFVPFRIVITSGSTYEVTGPLQLAVGETQFNYYFPRSDRWTILRQNQVAAFEVMEESKS